MKKYEEKYFSFSLNINEAEHLKCSEEEIDKLLKCHEKLSVNDVLKKRLAFQANLISLKGKKGEIAYVRSDSDYHHRNKYTLIFELPLSLTAEEQRNFVAFAYRLFKDKFYSETEVVENTQKPSKIVKRPFKEQKCYNYDPDNPKDRSPDYIFRTRTFADSKPHGTYSNRSKILAKRDEWIRKKYKQLRKQGITEYPAYDKIIEELARLPKDYFGKWNFKKQDPHILEVDSVKRIAQSKKS